jgi:uncharacterized protein YyaL (SSP411 family)
MDERFWDAERGGYFNSQAGDPNMVLRLKEDYDGAEPAASSVAAMNLLRLGAALDSSPGDQAGKNDSYRERGRKCIVAFRGQWIETAPALPQMLTALELALDAPRHVVLVGNPKAEDFQALHGVLYETLSPRRSVLAVTSEADREWFASRAPWMTEMREMKGKATAYVCEEYACQAPVTGVEELRQALR